MLCTHKGDLKQSWMAISGHRGSPPILTQVQENGAVREKFER
jgi:hypothetical protein